MRVWCAQSSFRNRKGDQPCSYCEAAVHGLMGQLIWMCVCVTVSHFISLPLLLPVFPSVSLVKHHHHAENITRDSRNLYSCCWHNLVQVCRNLAMCVIGDTTQILGNHESYHSVYRSVFTLTAVLPIESDPSTLVLEAFFHPTWVYTDPLAQRHRGSWEVCAYTHTGQSSRSVGRTPAALAARRSQV